MRSNHPRRSIQYALLGLARVMFTVKSTENTTQMGSS